MERLKTYDEENGSQYCQTLTTWIHSGFNREAVRSKLHIHRNTLSYRMDRIEEILGIDLNEGGVMLNLHLSELIYADKQRNQPLAQHTVQGL